jgi:hypothetical protein
VSRPSKKWRAAAVAFVLINVGGAGYAAAMGEWVHGAVHVLLLVAGYFMWPLVPGARPEDVPQAELTDGRMEYLQQSVDAIALEVERIGEAQRFADKLRAEQGEPPPPKNNPL